MKDNIPQIKTVFNVGVNDSGYTVTSNVNGKKVKCHFYQTWANMIQRCYDPIYQGRQTTYIECSVHPDWLLFSNFKKWMEQQDWQGKQLDKDLLVKGNKVYSQDTCVFVHPTINKFMNDQIRQRGVYPLGVSCCGRSGKFRSTCHNPFTKKGEHLGLFYCPNEAHLAWKKRKHELACKLADTLVDQPHNKKVIDILRTKYL